MGGRVQITGNSGAIYVTFGNEIITNPLNGRPAGSGEYLVIRDNCECSWKPKYLASNHPGLVRTTEQYTAHKNWGPYDYLISRIKAADGRISIGKVITPFYKQWYTNPATGVQIEDYSTTDVLVCDSTSDMSTKPTLNFGNKACALWSKYQQVNIKWPKTHGFSFGNDRFNQPAYIGRGNYADIQYLGRINPAENESKVFVTENQEPQATVPEYLVIPNNCNCEWMPYDTALNKIGLVRSVDFTYGFAIGRVDLGDGKYAISSVFTRDRWQKWADINGNVKLQYNVKDLLVCETA